MIGFELDVSSCVLVTRSKKKILRAPFPAPAPTRSPCLGPQNPCRSKRAAMAGQNTLYVGNVPNTLTEPEISQLFQNCGTVTQVRLAG